MGVILVVKIMVPVLGTLNIRCRIMIGTQKGTIILTTIHFYTYMQSNILNDCSFGNEASHHEAEVCLLAWITMLHESSRLMY